MTNALDSLNNTLQSEQFKKILPYLLIGGAGAAGGAYMTGGRRRNRNNPESRLGYIGRILKNSLIAGGLTAGVAGLARYGYDKLDKPTSVDGKQLPGMDNPTDAALRNALFSPVTALGAGTAGLLATHKIPHIGANTAARDSARAHIVKVLGLRDAHELMGMDPSKLKVQLENAIRSSTTGNPFKDGVQKAVATAGLTLGNRVPKGPLTDLRIADTLKSIAKAPGSAGDELLAMGKRLRQSPLGNAAVESAKAIGKGFEKVEGPDGKMVRNLGALKQAPEQILNELARLKDTPGANYRGEQARQFLSRVSRRGLSTLGQSGGRRAFRGGLGLTAAAIPALIGAFTTEEQAN
jgi:hypothetical protein